MKPEENSNRLLSAMRARAKMREFRAAPADFIELTREPKTLLALAIGILGDAAAALADRFISGSTESVRPATWEADDGSVSEMVRFSAQYFDTYLEALFDVDITSEFSLLCASSYYLSDSVGSAVVVIRRTAPPDIELGHGLARLAYALLSNSRDLDFSACAHADFIAEFLSLWQRFYDLEDVAGRLRETCHRLKENVYASGSARELLYADVVIAICGRKFENAAATVLPPSSGLPQTAWAPVLKKRDFPTELWPAQKLICGERILQGRSAVIQMPTSAGKTRSTEFMIRAHFLAQRSSLVVIVAPFRSLCHDVRSDLAKSFAGEQVLIDEVSDSYIFDVNFEEVRKQNSVFVVTPEKLLYILGRSPEFAESIGLIIYDEGHQFDGLSRGPTYELLLASMRISLPEAAQVILISAVITNAPQIAEWLVRDREAVISGKDLLPTIRNIAFTSWQFERAMLKYVSPQDPDEDAFFVPRVVGSSKLHRRPREKLRVFPERGTKNSKTDVGLYLALHLAKNGSVAIFCGTKESVGTVCKRAIELVERAYEAEWPSAYSDRAELARMSSLARLHLGEESPTSAAIDLGLFSHHSNTPPGLRLCIEHAMKCGLGRVVICTSTLAQGVNFPIRYLIVTTSQQGREDIKVRDFHNLMGRAGRAGMYTEGSVIFSSPSLIDEKRSGAGRWRWRRIKHLLDPTNSEPTTSSILELFEPYRQRLDYETTLTFKLPASWLDLTFATKATIAECVRAAVAHDPRIEAGDFEKFMTDRARAVQRIAAYLASYVDFESALATDRIEELAKNTLAYHLSNDERRAQLVDVFTTAARAIEGGAELELIRILRKSPLPPADVARLSEWIGHNFGSLIAIEDEDQLLSAIIDQALSSVKSAELDALDRALVLDCLWAWVSGSSYAQVCAILTAARVKIGREWPTSEIAVKICESGFGYSLSMAVAAFADLVEAQSPELYGRFSSLQKRIKVGLSSPSAIAFFDAGFSDRVVAQRLGAAFPTVVNRNDVRRVCRTSSSEILGELESFPAYFVYIARENGAI